MSVGWVKPSELESDVRELIRLAEIRYPDTIFDGTAPEHWVAGAIYVDAYVRQEDRSQESVAEEFNCDQRTVSRKYRSLIQMDAVDDYYGERLPHAPSLGALLSQRRATIRMLRVRTGETTKSIQRRLTACSRYDDEYQLLRLEKAGKVFYQTAKVKDVNPTPVRR